MNIKKRFQYLVFTMFFVIRVPAQNINQHFEKIRNSHNLLTAFFAAMPKGGDLHHHFSGSVYAETYLQNAVNKDVWVNPNTLEISEQAKDNFVQFSVLEKENKLQSIKQSLLQKWSIKDYNFVSYPADKHFFETFLHFNILAKNSLKDGLLEIKNRAKAEQVSYVETMLNRISNPIQTTEILNFNDSMHIAQQSKNVVELQKYLQKEFEFLQKNGFKNVANIYNKNIVHALHDSLRLDDKDFTIRFQNYVLRFMNPVDIFRDLMTAFESANASNLIVGVNIVAPEDNEIAMQDYWLHMQMYKFCHQLYPNVKYAVHAGELALGYVKPEELNWHINEAVYVAGASRIGHGVDIAHENKCFELLKYMKKNNIATEINLSSNEFILNIKDDKHPVLLYKKAGVPLVICSDDAGVLRSNLTEQFVLLAKRYSSISYKDIKQFVFNSIKYSFIKEATLKQKIIQKMQNDFKNFESYILNE